MSDWFVIAAWSTLVLVWAVSRWRLISRDLDETLTYPGDWEPDVMCSVRDCIRRPAADGLCGYHATSGRPWQSS